MVHRDVLMSPAACSLLLLLPGVFVSWYCTSSPPTPPRSPSVILYIYHYIMCVCSFTCTLLLDVWDWMQETWGWAEEEEDKVFVSCCLLTRRQRDTFTCRTTCSNRTSNRCRGDELSTKVKQHINKRLSVSHFSTETERELLCGNWWFLYNKVRRV